MAHHAPLARELSEQRRHHLLARARARDVDGAPAALDHVEREGQVVAHDRVDHDVGVAARGVDRAVAGGDRRQARLERAHGHLIAPVHALLVVGSGAGGRLHEADLPAGVADAGIVERGRRALPARPAPSARWRPRRPRSRRARPRPRRPGRGSCRRAGARARHRRPPRARAAPWRPCSRRRRR